jgi:hypothetical protein
MTFAHQDKTPLPLPGTRAPWRDQIARLPWTAPEAKHDGQPLFQRVLGIFGGQ